MKKAGTDPKVKKTLIRNYEHKVRTDRKLNAEDTAGPSNQNSHRKENKLDHPTLCTSEVLANYISAVRDSEPPPCSSEDLNVHKAEISTKFSVFMDIEIPLHRNRNPGPANPVLIESSQYEQPTSSNVVDGFNRLKITKKLNFHFNDRIYKNLVELNTESTHLNTKKDKKKSKAFTAKKKDLEPSIEDFCHNIKENDLSPNIPLLKHKFKPIRSVECGDLHKLVASFEKL